MSVGKVSDSGNPCVYIIEYTQGRNRIHVLSVGGVLVTHLHGASTKEYIEERNLICAQFVRRIFLTLCLCRSTSKYTQRSWK